MYHGKKITGRCFRSLLLSLIYAVLLLGTLTASAYNLGDRVQVTGTYNIRQTPAGTALGTQSLGSRGTITGGPTVATLSGTSYTWYDINFDTGTDGWIADVGLTTAWALGTDVYVDNGSINWTQVKAAGISFAFAKASEGVSFTDTQLTNNMKNGKAAGVLMGSYHFAHPLDNTGTNGAVAEAQHFLNIAKPFIGSGFLPPSLDVEDEPFGTNPSDPCSDGTDSAGTSLNLVCKLGQTALSAWVSAWVAEVKRQTGITAIVYMNRTYATTGMTTNIAASPLWLAYFETPPDISQASYAPWTNSWTFLQYSFTNTLSGVPDPTVDFNLFTGDPRALQLFAAQTATTNVIPPQISGIGGGLVQPPTNGQFQFEVSSPTQLQVIVQSSTNLTAWTNASTVTISHGHGAFTDTNLGAGTKFYRPHP